MIVKGKKEISNLFVVVGNVALTLSTIRGKTSMIKYLHLAAATIKISSGRFSGRRKTL